MRRSRILPFLVNLLVITGLASACSKDSQPRRRARIAAALQGQQGATPGGGRKAGGAARGDPASATDGLPSAGIDAAAPAGRRRAPLESDVSEFRGLYLRTSDSSLFQPCGASRYYGVVGTPEAVYLLRERFRFTAVLMGRPLFGVFQGALMKDAPGLRGKSGDTTAASQAPTRFFLVHLDTLRAPLGSDCRAVARP